ncbi:MAG: hypothetical protein C4560_07730 [Nitrospiraceae bacterium]|nr:MAG: hypothetical protein C4560_07730 [Nitrospiraceae bacterium]
MEFYRYKEIAYLVVPVSLGIEFFLSAKEEKKDKETAPVGSYLLDFLGYVFSALIPAIFFFTIWAIEYKAFPRQEVLLAKMDRYGVMFFFLGSWWQILVLTALKSRRIRLNNASKWKAWTPYLLLGAYISLLILWVAPWNLKWVSVFMFLALFGVLWRVTLKTAEKVLWALSVMVIFMENILFIFLETIV